MLSLYGEGLFHSMKQSIYSNSQCQGTTSERKNIASEWIFLYIGGNGGYSMNKAQKISLLVCVFSGVMFFISAYVYGNMGYYYGFDIESIFGTEGQNYIGMFSLALFAASFVGYFILGDKTK